MGRFLNRASNNNDFTSITRETYFVDKSLLIESFNKLLNTSRRFVCITRPKRFGKSVNAQMLASYYSCAMNTKDIFDKLNISKCPSYLEHLNKHNVVHISFNVNGNNFKTFDEYMAYFETELVEDLKELYPDIPSRYKYAYDAFDYVHIKTDQNFIFIIDEWDYIFDKQLFSLDDRKSFLDFLVTLLKDRDYVDLAYMTGILPISKYSNSSSLNNFSEHASIDDNVYGEYLGFLEEEVEELCKKQDILSMNDLQEWYNGYYTKSGKHLYNPRSVVYALNNGQAFGQILVNGESLCLTLPLTLTISEKTFLV